jgi:alkylhydroperoxidase family enzyme
MESDGGDAKLSELTMWRDSRLFSEAERVALEYAERVTITDQRVADVLFSRLAQHYTEAQIVELTAVIAFENYRSKFNPSLGVDAQGFCTISERSPKNMSS